MILHPFPSISGRLLSFTSKLRRHISCKIHNAATSIPPEEASHYFKQAIDLCYHTQGHKMPLEFKHWIERGIQINFLELPEDIRNGITGVLFNSSTIKKTIQQFLFNLPQ